MNRKSDIIPPSSFDIFGKLCEIRRKGVSVQKDYMFLVNFSHRLNQTVIDTDDSLMERMRIGWFVEKIVSCYPGIGSIVRRND